MTDTPLVLTHEFEFALDRFESNQHLFITGRAGTGKSTLLQLIRKSTRKQIAVVAPTGVAALNVKGQTIHSFFKLPGKLLTKQDIRRRNDRRLYQKLDTLIIDEVSMVRADLIDRLDDFLRINRDKPTVPFGGVQLVMFGDLFQLPPVVANPTERSFFQGEHAVYKSPYFFDAHVWQQAGEIEMFELNQVFRQKARHFVRMLDAVREGQFDYDDLMDLNTRHVSKEEFGAKPGITLTSTNKIAGLINQKELAAIPGIPSRYIGELTGNFDQRNLPTDLALSVKVGAQVMFVKNDTEKRFVNGSIGEVIEANPEEIIVRLSENNTEQEISLNKDVWENIRYSVDDRTGKISEDVVGSFKQFPIKLAWAITIHKSQGKTFERLTLDLGRGAFESGQTYVALSRCRTLEGIRLKNPLTGRDIIVDERICDWYQRHR